MSKLLGPGILVAIAYLDPGNLAGDIEAGVKGGYHLLWVLMLSTLLGYCVVCLGWIGAVVWSSHCAQRYLKHCHNWCWIYNPSGHNGCDLVQITG